MLQREGRWASDAYKAFVPSREKNAGQVASLMALEGLDYGIQPEQGTEWGQVDSLLSWIGRSRCEYSGDCSGFPQLRNEKWSCRLKVLSCVPSPAVPA